MEYRSIFNKLFIPASEWYYWRICSYLFLVVIAKKRWRNSVFAYDGMTHWLLLSIGLPLVQESITYFSLTPVFLAKNFRFLFVSNSIPTFHYCLQNKRKWRRWYFVWLIQRANIEASVGLTSCRKSSYSQQQCWLNLHFLKTKWKYNELPAYVPWKALSCFSKAVACIL